MWKVYKYFVQVLVFSFLKMHQNSKNYQFLREKSKSSLSRRGVVVMATAQLESNPARSVLEICDGKDL